MGWLNTEPVPRRRRGWLFEEPEDAEAGVGWIPLPFITGTDLAIGREQGFSTPSGVWGLDRSLARELGISGLTLPVVGESAAIGREEGSSRCWSGGDTRAIGREIGRHQVLASESDRALARELGLSGSYVGGLDRALARDLATQRVTSAGVDRALAREAGDAGWKPQAVISGQVTANGWIDIPAWVRYVDIILLGGGGGGAGGNQVGADGRGGAAGLYVSIRWDRGPGRNLWSRLYFTIGTGGSGGSRNNNGSGGSGGSTTCVVHTPSAATSTSLTAGGGTGGSGTNPVFGNERPGKAPGNHSLNGLSAVGGGENGDVPGAGGQGGGGSTWPLNSGSGSVGARGQGWYQLSM